MEDRAQRFIETFGTAARQAGAVAMRLRGHVRAESKAGFGSAEAEALTAADLATQDVILYLLARELPGVAVDAEEDTESTSLFAPARPGGPLVVVDPIDGTLNYIRGSDDFAVMGSLLEHDAYRASLVHFPAHGVTYWAIRGEGCFLARRGEAPERLSRLDAPSRILVTPSVPPSARDALIDLVAELEVSRCSAVDSSAPAISRARASVCPEAPDRRRAVGLLLSLELGATILIGGRRWRGEDPDHWEGARGPLVVAATPALAEAVQERLQR